MQFLNEIHFVEVEVPSGVGANTTLTTSLGSKTGFNLGSPWQSSQPVIVRRTTAAGVSKSVDETVSIDANGNLIIAEGTSGFLGDEIYLVLLIAGNLSRETAVAS